MVPRPPISERDRTRIISDRFDYHRSVPQIARRRRCSRSSVQRVCQQHVAHVDYEKRRHHGRTPALNQKQVKHLFNTIRSNRNATSSELSRHLFHHDKINISPRSLRRYRRMIFHPVHEILIPPLTEKHLYDRMDYCETIFILLSSLMKNHFVWLIRRMLCGSRKVILSQLVKSSQLIPRSWFGVVYGIMASPNLLFLNLGRVDHRKYIEVLGKYLLPTMPTADDFCFNKMEQVLIDLKQCVSGYVNTLFDCSSHGLQTHLTSVLLNMFGRGWKRT